MLVEKESFMSTEEEKEKQTNKENNLQINLLDEDPYPVVIPQPSEIQILRNEVGKIHNNIDDIKQILENLEFRIDSLTTKTKSKKLQPDLMYPVIFGIVTLIICILVANQWADTPTVAIDSM